MESTAVGGCRWDPGEREVVEGFAAGDDIINSVLVHLRLPAEGPQEAKSLS